MIKNVKNQRIIVLIMLGLAAVIWGAGFVFADDLLAGGFSQTPGLQNALRFSIGTIVLLILLRKHINFGGKNFLYGLVGGVLLFAGFMLQLEGQNHITPAHCGFFTALYFVITPFIAWIVNKKAPNISVWIAIIIAIAGLVILNLGKFPTTDELFGTLLTIASALMFSIQIVWSDYLLKNDKMNSNNLVVIQLVVASVLFVLYSLIFESKHYATMTIDWNFCWWRLAVVSLLGTGFAYFAQTSAQNVISPSQTSLILACESPIGAALSIALGIDLFSWNIVIGGLLVLASVVVIELVPNYLEKRKAKQQQ